MAFFTTFYSYKGGVGRTLALANVAWFLANHATEPAKVLVIDFDLAAPGLHRVLKMARQDQSPGLLDFVLEYTSTAKLPKVDNFIHRTAYPGIDLMPAGRLDKNYKRRLEALNWAALYEEAYGFQLIEALKSEIAALPTNYDYVLIDSLTGFSDVGGICVQQLPDSLVLLFRLNQQNLDGIEAVYKSASKRPELKIMPVISPAWPFIDKAADVWLKKTQAVFGKLRLHEISFDSGLSFGEAIIASVSPRLILTPKVISDYQQLSVRLRAQNSSDPLTLWENLRSHLTTITPESAAEDHLRLLKKRPNNLQYWQFLDRSVQRYKRPKKVDVSSGAVQRLLGYVNEQCDAGNKMAFLGRAGLELIGEDGKALQDLSRALEIDPRFYEASILRARVYLQRGNPRNAVTDLLQCMNLLSKKDPRRREVASEIGAAALEFFDAPTSVKYLQIAIELGSNDIGILTRYIQACYLDGRYEKALETSERILRLTPRNPMVLNIKAQLLAASGMADAASDLLAAEEDGADADHLANLAEAYLAIKPSRALELLDSERVNITPSISVMLKLIALVFLKMQDPIELQTELDQRPLKKIDSESDWMFHEIVSMLVAKRRKTEITEAMYRAAMTAVKQTSLVDIPY